MKLKFVTTLFDDNKVSIVDTSWAPNNKKIAIATSERVILLFDENGTQKDKFSSKPGDSAAGKKSYTIVGIEFSENSEVLAVMQSDLIVFVYRLGLDWTTKKVICNKFLLSSMATCIIATGNGFLTGTSKGEVRYLPILTKHMNELSIGFMFSTNLEDKNLHVNFSNEIQQILFKELLKKINKIVEITGRVFLEPLFGWVVKSLNSASYRSRQSFVTAGYQNRAVGSGNVYEITRRVLDLKSNKSNSMWSGPAGCVSLAQSLSKLEDLSIMSGHADGTIVLNGRKILKYILPPTALCIVSNHFLVGSCDGKISMYTLSRSSLYKIIELPDTIPTDQRDILTAKINPSGQTLAFAAWNGCLLLDLKEGNQIESSFLNIPYFYATSCVDWNADGTKLVVASQQGSVLLYEAVLRRWMWSQSIEIRHVSPKRVILTRIDADDVLPLVVETELGNDIFSFKFLGEDWYAVCRTNCSLILCDLMQGLSSEIPWNWTGTEKFFTQATNVCLIYRAGEITIVQYGIDQVLLVVRSERGNPHVMSVRLVDDMHKTFAYLVDKQTVSVIDVVTGKSLLQSWHDCKIDWLELNELGETLLFRDVHKRLYLLNISTGVKEIIASGANFVQWIEDSDAVVAQTSTHALIWYNVREPSCVELLDTGGELITEVRDSKLILQSNTHGGSQPCIQLDSHRLRFNSAVRANDLEGCAEYLRAIPKLNNDVIQLWKQLAERALLLNDLTLAAECYEQMGDKARAYFLRKTIKLAESEGEMDFKIGIRSPLVRGRLEILAGDLKSAEDIYIKYGNFKEAIEMYKKLNKWSEAIAVADKFDLHLANKLKDEQLHFLTATGRIGSAGALLAERGRTEEAIQMWLKGGRPRRAATLLINNPHLLSQHQVVSSLIDALVQGEWWEMAGEICEKRQENSKAIEYFTKGNNFARAIQLAREVDPSAVRELESAWGEWLLSNRRAGAAVQHLIEAGRHSRALQAAIAARQYTHAQHILRSIEDKESVKKESLQLGKYFMSIQDWKAAENVMVRTGLIKECIESYNEVEKYAEGLKLAMKYLPKDEVDAIYKYIAQELEEKGELRKAEKIYINLNLPDDAISMYKRVEDYAGMVRVVEACRPELLEQTLIHIAQTMQQQSDYSSAEKYYLRAGDWKSAIQMYRSIENWEAADQVAKQYAPENVQHQVLFLWASTMSASAGARLLCMRGAGEIGIRLAAKQQRWELAEQLARKTDSISQRDLLLLKAKSQEPEDAEALYIEANAADLAVDMWMERSEFARALQLAQTHATDKVDEILENYAEWAERNGDVALFETLMLRANRIDDLVQYYLDHGMESDAERVRGEGSGVGADVAEALQMAAKHARSNRHEAAVRELCRASQLAAESNEWEVAERAALRAARVARYRLPTSHRHEAALLIAQRMSAIGQEDVGEQIRSALLEGYHSEDDAEEGENEMEGEEEGGGEEIEKAREEMLNRWARAGDWERCLNAAGNRAPHYAALHARFLLQDENDSSLESALSVLRRWGSDKVDIQLAKVLLARASSRLPYTYNIFRDTRDVLYSAASSNSTDEELWQVMWICLLCGCACAKGSSRLASRAARSLLRYTHLVVADAAYYTAGVMAREEGSTSEALILLNRCLDLAEAADEQTDPATLDFDDFACTDFPRDVLLDHKATVKDEMLDEIREWVLTYSMETKSNQGLPLDSRSLYPCSLGAEDEWCILTGYPMSTRVVRFANGKWANRESWSRLVAASNDDQHADIAADIIAFLTLWCGSNDYIAV